MPDMRSAMNRAGFRDKPRSEGGHPRDQGRRRDERTAMPSLPATYFSADAQDHPCLNTAFVSKGNMDPMARYFAKDARPRLTTGQVRRFFNHCRMIERRLALDGEPWERVSASFEMLSCHAQNAQAAGKIPDEFQRFIEDNVARVVSSADPKTSFLEGFLPHFEALVGFGAAHLKSLT